MASMTPSGARIGVLAAASLAGFLQPTAAQTEVLHHFHFELGDEVATVKTTFRGCSGDALRVAMPTNVGHPNRRRSAGRSADKITLRSRGETPRALGDGTWSIPTNGAAVVHLTHHIPITGRGITHGLGQRQAHKFEADGEPKTVRYHQGYALRAPSTWLFSLSNPDAPQRVTFQTPPGFKVATTLRQESPGSYRAPDFGALADAPFHIGESKVLEFRAAGRDYRVHLTGFERDRTDLSTFQGELAKIARAQSSSLGVNEGRPYVYLIGRSTGLPNTIAHRDCSEILTHSLRSSKAQLLNISRAHLWSWVRPLKATELVPPVSGREDWFFEGVTEYLAELALVRAGLEDPKRYWATGIAAHINKLQRDPRRLTTSVTKTSGDQRSPRSRDKKSPGRPDPKTKGLLLGLLLDVEIRARSLNTRTLDHAVRAMIEAGAPVDNAKIAQACAATLGKPLSKFFTAYVEGTSELPLTNSLARAGIRAGPIQAAPTPKGNPRIPRSNRRRPPRWQVNLTETPSEQALGIRTQMTEVVAK